LSPPSDLPTRIFDLGVGGGLDAMVLGLQGATVVGVEALPSAFARLQYRLHKRLGLDNRQITLLHSAIVSESTQQQLRLAANGSKPTVRFF